MNQKRQAVEPADNASMGQDLVVSMNAEDALLVGSMRIEVMQTKRGRVVCRVEAPDQPVILLSRGGRVKLGAHHRLIDET